MTEESGTQRLVPETWVDTEDTIHLRTDAGALCPTAGELVVEIEPTENASAADLCTWCQHIASLTGAIELPEHLRKRGVVA
ncbi:MAG: hypothetical protein ACOCUA_02935 [archaeon]